MRKHAETTHNGSTASDETAREAQDPFHPFFYTLYMYKYTLIYLFIHYIYTHVYTCYTGGYMRLCITDPTLTLQTCVR